MQCAVGAVCSVSAVCGMGAVVFWCDMCMYGDIIFAAMSSSGVRMCGDCVNVL